MKKMFLLYKEIKECIFFLTIINYTGRRHLQKTNSLTMHVNTYHYCTCNVDAGITLLFIFSANTTLLIGFHRPQNKSQNIKAKKQPFLFQKGRYTSYLYFQYIVIIIDISEKIDCPHFNICSIINFFFCFQIK